MTRLPILLSVLAMGLGANLSHAQDLDGYLSGDMRGVVIHEAPIAVSSLEFTDMEDGRHSLSDFEGQVVLLNFWATWCAPCREEMPALEALQETLGGEDFQVVTLATGRNPTPAITRFFEETGIEHLPTYLDPRQDIARDMGVFGLPITVIIDREGHEIGRLRGDAHWDSPDAIALLQAVIDG